MTPDVRGMRGVAVFAAAFAVLWTASVIAVWQQGWLSEPLRPWFRALFWLGAATLWLAWLQPERPLQWIGLGPPSTHVRAFLGVLEEEIVFRGVLQTQLPGG